MTKNKRRITSLVLVLVMSFGLMSTRVGAAGHEGKTDRSAPSEYDGHTVQGSDDGRFYLNISSVANKNVWNYRRTNVRINGTALSVKGIVINNTHYIPTRAAANVLGASYAYDSNSKTATLTAPGLKLVMGAGGYVNYANERVLFSMTPNVIMSDGRMYIPASSFAKAIGMTAKVSDDELSLSGKLTPILHADKFYREDEVFWLGRIIHAEAEGEPLLGKIAVGNVVLNRVKSAYYPNTIYGVIFDRKYGVQFSPILNGTIYNTPNFNSTLAAKICLEGFDVSDGAFFFLAPHLATSSWIPKSREYAFTISNHDFYR